MSADEPTFYNMKRLHAVFALAAVALLTVTIWAMLVDAQRPWKQFQRTFHRQIQPDADAPSAWQPQIDEIDLPDLAVAGQSAARGRVDRCPTCHQGIERTLPDVQQPYRCHPRPDLFVAEHSPHPLAQFGCTACHEGQGSATDFCWASHTPDNLEQQARWRQQYGWSRNPHWDFPMLPGRFVQARCLQCHPAVTDLEASRRYSDPPAGKLLAGYRLVRQLGCWGCHEMGISGLAVSAGEAPGSRLLQQSERGGQKVGWVDAASPTRKWPNRIWWGSLRSTHPTVLIANRFRKASGQGNSRSGRASATSPRRWTRTT